MTIWGQNSTKDILLATYPLLPLFFLIPQLSSQKQSFLRLMLWPTIFVMMVIYLVVGSNMTIVTATMIPIMIIGVDELWHKVASHKSFSRPPFICEWLLLCGFLMHARSPYLLTLSIIIAAIGIVQKSGLIRLWIVALMILFALHTCTGAHAFLLFIFFFFFCRAKDRWQEFFERVSLKPLLILAFFYGMGSDLHKNRQQYLNNEPLVLEGTSGIHLPKPTTDILHEVCQEIHNLNPSSLYSCPGLFSFNLWTGIQSPTHFNNGLWPYMATSFKTDQQQALIKRLEEEPNSVIIWSDTVLAFWGNPALLIEQPLVNFIRVHYQPHRSIGPYTILIKQ